MRMRLFNLLKVTRVLHKTAVQKNAGAVVQPENLIEAVRKTKHKK